MIEIIADMEAENATTSNSSLPTIMVQEQSDTDFVSINSVPITAIFLALVASCNSGEKYFL